MELLLTLFVLYGAQCLIVLQRGGSVVGRALFRGRITSGPGWRILHPRPNAPSFVATRFFLEEDNEGLRGRETPGRFGLPTAIPTQPRVDLAAIEHIETRGKIVRIDGLAFYRAESKVAATRVADLLRELAQAEPDQIRERIASEISASLSLPDYHEQLEKLARATRVLAWLLDGYFFFLFLALPCLFLLVHSEPALLLAFPVVLLAQVAALIAFVISYRKLYPERSGELAEQLISAALYPPLLLRTIATLRIDLLSRFHPAVHAVAMLTAEERRDFLRRELASARFAGSSAPNHIGLADMEHKALLKLLEASGEALEVLLAPPDKIDAFALAYCPLCGCEYLRADCSCVDCKVPLVPFCE